MGCRTYLPEADGWLWAECKATWVDGKFVADETFIDDYTPTHWMSLPNQPEYVK
jgi:hypothetical protein